MSNTACLKYLTDYKQSHHQTFSTTREQNLEELAKSVAHYRSITVDKKVKHNFLSK